VIDAGKLRERVTVQIPSGSTNPLGETVISWGNSTAVWASGEGVSAREALALGQQETLLTHRVRMRYVPGLTQDMRLSWRGRTLDIISLLEHGHRSEHEAICEEQR